MSRVIIALAFVALFAVASAAHTQESIFNLWGAWKTAHGKRYTSSEEAHRLNIFQTNLVKIAKLNAENNGAKYAVNQFADLTSSEFKQKYANSAFVGPVSEDEYESVSVNGVLPDAVDWRNKGAVTPVKNQAQCGSCWAFSAVGVIESFYFVKNGKLVRFSEQQVVDCATAAGKGCQGGWPYLAIDYAAKNGLETEADYPYNGKDNKCKYDKTKAIKVCSGRTMITPRSSDQLKNALVSSPVSVLVQADQSAFQFYKSGVVSTGCGAAVNHAVLAVGYQKVGALEAFIVKNSWGTGWGSDGYIYLSTIQQLNNGNGACGVLYQPVVPK